jgi:hypothetical protein
MANTAPANNQDIDVLTKAVEEGGSYAVIKQRLNKEGDSLLQKVDQLNAARIEEFGGTQSEVIGKENITTENKCIPVDMAQIGGYILFGYEVTLGMKSQVNVNDVLSLYTIKEDGESFRFEQVKTNNGSFIDDADFVKSFKNLYRYYKDAKLVQVTKSNRYLLVAFKVGTSVNDLKVYRWEIKRDGSLAYKDDQGNKDLETADTKDLNWIDTSRNNLVEGKHPHISILDKVFVETTGGDLTIKLENNTEQGLGIYSEPVDDINQSVEDADISYVDLGNLILLRIKPYREETVRHFVYNQNTEKATRIDSLGNSCIELPENHGVVFPNGYYLESGDYKEFEEESDNLAYFTTISSPNGEDYMYIFYDAYKGFYSIYSYNIIRKTLSNPIHAHGYSIFEDGKMVIFRESDNMDPTKIHPMHIWQTPYVSDMFFSDQQKSVTPTFYTKIGNNELVRSVSDLYTICQYIERDEVSSAVFEGLIKLSTKLMDEYHWLEKTEVENIKSDLIQISSTSNTVIDEFEKVKSIQRQAQTLLLEAQALQKDVISKAKLANPSEISPNVQALSALKKQLGHLISIRDQRYINTDELKSMEEKVHDAKNDVNAKLIDILQDSKSFKSYFDRIQKVEDKLADTTKVIEIEPLESDALEVTEEIDLINNEVNEIDVSDATLVTKILDTVSEVFSKLNQLKSRIKNKKKSFLSTEAKAEFASQFKLLSQAVSSAIGKADTPDLCDEQLSRLLGQVETLESKFSSFDEYLTSIYEKREEIQGVFESHKQQLLSDLQKRAVSIEKSAKIAITAIGKKAERFEEVEGLNSYFASDNMVLKVHQLVESLKKLGDNVKADDLEARIKKIKDQSLRSLRDNKDIFEKNGTIMKMGKHRFSVNTKNVNMTVLPIDGVLTTHLTGTDFYEPLRNEELMSLKHVWDLDTLSETKTVYRGEYLAYSVLSDAESGLNNLSMATLKEACALDTGLSKILQDYIATRYQEGYIKGVHDHDAGKILSQVVKVYEQIGDLRFSQSVRSHALLYLSAIRSKDSKFANLDINSYKQAYAFFNNLGKHDHLKQLFSSAAVHIKIHFNETISDMQSMEIAEYMYQLLATNEKQLAQKLSVTVTQDADALCTKFSDFQTKSDFTLKNDISLDNYCDVKDWVFAFAETTGIETDKFFVEEAALIYIIRHNEAEFITLNVKPVKLTIALTDLLGDHPRIENGDMVITLDNFLTRTKHQKEVVAPDYKRYLSLRHEVIQQEEKNLQLDSFKANPLTSFVRNRLITESYLKLIGDNFAKQMGTVGQDKRSDLMGMLLLISPPGYGKTTLVEYVANKLGLVFMKINCPSLNHEVVSLDPNEAPDVTAKKELEKLNLALEMGNNVMLYLDDIQHTNPEFLQKFISLCDGTRKIDGVWKGEPKTYDMKGKKFSVVMAGNPYTESGEAFKIPDMLANRADIYNLGDMLGGQQEVFELSYIENSLTSNSVLAPLANRDLGDLYKLIDIAKGKNIALTDLDHNYSTAEANEIVSILKKMITIQKVVLRVNQQYILSAAVEDKYREEPPFRLQGSYRNMNKMVEKLVPAMNDDDVEQLILDHYKGESQTLTVGAEDNYLKLKIMLEMISDVEKQRWDAIMSDFGRHKMMGDSDTDGSSKIAAQLESLSKALIGSNKDKILGEALEEIAKKDDAVLQLMEKFAPNSEKETVIIDTMRELMKYVKVRNDRNSHTTK